MKILAFGDIHGSLKALERLKAKVEKENPDLILCTGDITIFEQHLDYIMHKIDRLGKKVLMVHGNHEEAHVMTKMSKMFDNLIFIHQKHYRINSHLFLGYGGGGFSTDDRRFREISKRFEEKIKKGDKIVLITHAPPYGTKIDLMMEEHCGSKAIRDFIAKVKPVLVISGHLHENNGKTDEKYGAVIANPGHYGKIFHV